MDEREFKSTKKGIIDLTKAVRIKRTNPARIFFIIAKNHACLTTGAVTVIDA